MHKQSLSSYVEKIREEIKLIENQEFLYRKLKHHSSEEITARDRRESRLLAIRAELQKLRIAEA